jgi:hypothetical protein
MTGTWCNGDMIEVEPDVVLFVYQGIDAQKAWAQNRFMRIAVDREKEWVGPLPAEPLCAADFGNTKPCCGQNPHEKEPVPVADRCPSHAPICQGYVYGKHLGLCETVTHFNAIAAQPVHHVREALTISLKSDDTAINCAAPPPGVQATFEQTGLVSVKAFGALGNSSQVPRGAQHDDAPAIRDTLAFAAACGGLVFFPPGVYGNRR